MYICLLVPVYLSLPCGASWLRPSAGVGGQYTYVYWCLYILAYLMVPLSLGPRRGVVGSIHRFIGACIS